MNVVKLIYESHYMFLYILSQLNFGTYSYIKFLCQKCLNVLINTIKTLKLLVRAIDKNFISTFLISYYYLLLFLLALAI